MRCLLWHGHCLNQYSVSHWGPRIKNGLSFSILDNWSQTCVLPYFDPLVSYFFFVQDVDEFIRFFGIFHFKVFIFAFILTTSWLTITLAQVNSYYPIWALIKDSIWHLSLWVIKSSVLIIMLLCYPLGGKWKGWYLRTLDGIISLGTISCHLSVCRSTTS